MRLFLCSNFSSKKLQGPIPEAIGNLTQLNELYVLLSVFSSKFMLRWIYDLTTMGAVICMTITSLGFFRHLCLLSNT